MSSDAQTLTGRTARGFAWLLGQSLVAKLINTAGQIALAWLLLPEDWGLIGLAFTISSFLEYLRTMGVQQLLVHRQRRFQRWANAGFWMCAILGLVAGVLMSAVAVPVSWLYHEPGLVGVLLALAVAMPLRSLGVVPEARLQIDLRFRTLATLNVIQVTSVTLMTIGFAALGFRAYSFVFPHIIFALVRAGILWRLAPTPLRWSPQLRRWRFMVGDSAKIFFSRVLQMATWQAAFIVLGVFQPAETVGLYFFSVQVADQTLRHVTLHLGTVLFPALTRLSEESSRQVNAFLRACRLLAIVALPLCLLQAALSAPFVHVVLAERWIPAIPLMQILSIGAAFRVINVPSLSLIQAQGRWGTLLLVNLLQAVVTLTAVTAGALVGGVVEIALAATAAAIVVSPIQSLMAIRPAGGTWGDVWRIHAAPAAVAVVAVGGAALLSRLVPEMAGARIVEAAVILIVAGALYPALIRLAAPADTADLWQRIRGVMPVGGRRKLKPKAES